MAATTGAYSLQLDGADELKRALQGTERGMRDLSSLHREIGRKAGEYVKAHQPIPSFYDNKRAGKARLPDGYLQDHTKGGGGKTGAYVQAEAPYLFLQEFGGKSFWHRSGAGSVRRANRGHRKMLDAAASQGVKGHVVYEKDRRRDGYFIWNVVFRLRRPIGEAYTSKLAEIADKNGLHLEITPSDLGIDRPMRKPT
jgi:hypothetical protein